MKKSFTMMALVLVAVANMGVVFSLPGGTNLTYSFAAPGWKSQVVMRVGGCVTGDTDPTLLSVECDDSRAVGAVGALEDPDTNHNMFSADVRVSAHYLGVDWSTDCRLLYDGTAVTDSDVTINVEGP